MTRQPKPRLGYVFYISVVIITIFVAWGFIRPAHLDETAGHALAFVTRTFGWFYLFATFIFLAFALYLAFGPYGQIKLGKKDEDPEYNYWTWLGMLFSAGMGIGLVFWGVAEPIYHYMSPPEGLEGESVEAAKAAMRYAFFHWGLHPWAIYTIVGLALAYAQFRKGESGLISSTFRPLIGDRVDGPLGIGIDTLAAIATAFGVATSLGLGTLQINGGLSHVFGLPNNTTMHLLIIMVVTVLYMISASTGLNRGIRYLSNVNLSLAGLLLLFVLLAGPSIFILETFTTTIGNYLGSIIPMSFRLTPFTQGEWVGAWTLFYWAWWIAWAPFVGTFIARVSRGRTIREFVSGVLLVPTLIGALWFATFGGSALHLEMFEGVSVTQAVSESVEGALFFTLEQFPLGLWLSILATLLIITFFVTSADSATFVLGMLTSQGALNPKVSTKFIWGILQSGIAGVLLLSGGLNGLQTASIVAALPFTIIMLFMILSLNKALKAELREERRREKMRIRKLEQLIEEELGVNPDDSDLSKK
ncbi:choline/carnitine/betaine transporter [Caldalkalibacillus thermarum TA2.A1]|uniref:Choline/carnitine/betaine transporter n=1 Tax=Caldalkalibacillus thermarum (strain TA2.A1) TaxID=986075 RepID=F5L696_CALTT|nr:BCCT family transporter [Caldalkalibacillus thermarum]EGL83146.1 choline/carnitine/betaine transporter [Caldalkalibacillus thermarum TA2.A1]